MEKKNGGSAFPLPASSHSVSGGTAFTLQQEGMTLRDWFASVALIGLLSNPTTTIDKHSEAAKHAYIAADAMISEREKE
jgi:hypothetical protein